MGCRGIREGDIQDPRGQRDCLTNRGVNAKCSATVNDELGKVKVTKLLLV
jgi:hypothetical protein